MHQILLVPAIIIIVLILTKWANTSRSVTRGRSVGFFQIPTYPIFGNLLQLFNNPALTYITWSKAYSTPIFQIKLGNRSAIVVNSFKDVHEIWLKHARSCSSRPMGYTFHNVVSSTQGFTVGSSPQGELFRRKKKVLGLYLNKVCLERYGEIIGSESEYVLEELERSVRSNHNEGDVDVLELFQMYALRTSVFLSYGIHLDCYKKDSSLCKEILAVENQIIRFRSPSSNLADYVPMLRLFPSHAEDYRSRRDKYMNYFYEELVSKLGTSSYDNSIIGRILRNNQQNLSSEELQSICLTLVSAGLDNTSLNLNHLLGQLSQTHGLEYQTIARQLLLRLYKDSTTAYEMAAKELKSTYILALIHETLRFFTVLPLSLPRLTTKPIIHGGAVIPENTILIMNAYAANHDPDHFPNPDTFSPARWLEGDYLIKNVVHFGFGIGSRECSGAGLAVREMYTLVSRLLLVYEVHPPETSPMGLDCFEMNTLGGTSFEPRAFNVKLKRLVRV